eukprot:scaffold33638_cov84-Phaeocystis_antarctica.AAC.3
MSGVRDMLTHRHGPRASAMRAMRATVPQLFRICDSPRSKPCASPSSSGHLNGRTCAAVGGSTCRRLRSARRRAWGY